MCVLEDIQALRDFETDIYRTIQGIECRLNLIEARAERNVTIYEFQARIEVPDAQCAKRSPLQKSFGENIGSDDVVNDEPSKVLHDGKDDLGE